METTETIRHRVGIYAPIDEVYRAFTTPEGVAAWWCRDTTGSADGRSLEFRFGAPEPWTVMELTDLAPPSRVVWNVVQGPSDWLGARITFDLRSEGEETVVLFAHDGWREAQENMSHCSTTWAYFLMGLKRGMEGGKATPFPDREYISSWA